MPRLNFDKPVDRTGSLSVKWLEAEAAPGLIPLWVADTDFPAPPEVVEALEARVRHGVFGYSYETDDFYDALIRWVGSRSGFAMQRSWLQPTRGLVNGLSILVNLLTEPGAPVLVQTPVYHRFFSCIEGSGRRVARSSLKLEHGRYTMDFDDMEAQFAAGVRAMVLCNPHNPVGRVWTREELTRLGKLCVRYGVALISDDIHSDLVFPPHRYTPVASLGRDILERTVTMYSPAKTFNLAAFATSMLCVPNDTWRSGLEELMDRYEMGGVDLLGQIAFQTAYAECGYYVDELNRYLEENRRYVADAVRSRIPLLEPLETEGTYLMLLDCTRLPLNGEAPSAFFHRAAGVSLNDGALFGEESRGCVRLNFGTRRALLAEALDRMERAVHQLITSQP